MRQARVAELSFSHMGFFVRNIERMADFYTRLLGFAVSSLDDTAQRRT